MDLMVSAVPVPVFVADYTPILERFSGMTGDRVRALLDSDDLLLMECLTLPRPIAASPEWTRLYGSPVFAENPDLKERHFSVEGYPELRETLIQQFSAPFSGVTSIIREHLAPTVFGDVIVRSHWRPLMDEGLPLWDRIVIADLDVTDLRSAQRDLEAILEAKDHLVQSKEQLIASVSHEIRTPLSSIVGFARLLYDDADLPESDRQEMIGLLVQQSGDLTNIVDDLLVAAKTDAGQMAVARVSVDLRAQAAQAVESLDVASRDRVSLPTQSIRCMGDPARVRQIVRNLVSNAVRYGGPSIEIAISRRTDGGCLTVSDDGSGIPEKFRDTIFDPYDRGNKAPGLAPSMGLGLHISRTLARLMGGSLSYRYEAGTSAFELTLPLADPPGRD
jgi:signal transduction histidine kinase